MTNEEIRSRLETLAEADYRAFSQKLLPGTEHILGVRLPALRKFARELARGEWRAYLSEASDSSFEEIMLQGMVIGCAKAEPEEILLYVEQFLPKIDNWSVCDSFCAGLKLADRKPKPFWEFLQPRLNAREEFVCRFGLVLLLFHFIREEYIGQVLSLLGGFSHPGYYAQMAAAWAISICYVKFPEPTLALLHENRLDDFTFNKALQKITESNRVSPEEKAVFRAMKRR